MVFRIRRSSHLEKTWMDSTFREYAATTTREISRAFAEGEMTQDEIIEMAKQSGLINKDYDSSFLNKFTYAVENFAKLVAQHERELIAEIIEDAPDLVEFAQNEQGGCLMCGFTPKLAAEYIRARGQA